MSGRDWSASRASPLFRDKKIQPSPNIEGITCHDILGRRCGVTPHSDADARVRACVGCYIIDTLLQGTRRYSIQRCGRFGTVGEVVPRFEVHEVFIGVYYLGSSRSVGLFRSPLVALAILYLPRSPDSAVKLRTFSVRIRGCTCLPHNLPWTASSHLRLPDSHFRHGSSRSISHRGRCGWNKH